MAIPAITIDAAHPRNTDPGPPRQLRCLAFDDLSYNLVTRDESRLNRWQIALNDVQVSTADPASDDPKQHVSRHELGLRNILNLKKGSRR
jgi:hypothetical protein